MFRKFRPRLILVTAFAVFGIESLAQEQQTAAEVQEKVREWVRVQKTITAEKSDWDQQKKILSDLNEIRRKEIAKIDELIAAAGERFADAENQRNDLSAEETALLEKRVAIEKRVTALENGLRERLAFFPAPLLVEIDEEAGRLLKSDADALLQNRFRDVIAVLTEAGEFENKITVDTDLLEIDSQPMEVDVIYLGLHHAYFVNRTGSQAGTGKPSPDGWKWRTDPNLASEIRASISIIRRESAPRFVKLPLLGKESAE